MEFAVDTRIPNYAGGLGVLAADYMLSVADMDKPVIGVGLVYHQSDNHAEAFHAGQYMHLREERIQVNIEDRNITVGAYEYEVKSPSGKSSTILFLTTNFPENPRWDRDLTKWLYPSNTYTRIAQEAILGIGGVRILQAMGHKGIEHYHMNEGHSAFLTLELLKQNDFKDERVKELCRFTTHTPVKAGHDYFDYDLVSQILGEDIPWHIRELATAHQLSMTHLAMNLSQKTNSVSEKHREVCGEMFPGYEFENVTNGIHHLRWVSPDTAKVFDTAIPTWKEDPSALSQAPEKVKPTDLWSAHQSNKQKLIDWINHHPEFFSYHSPMLEEDYFDGETLTIAFARRFVPYKRPGLIFRDIEKLRPLGYKRLQLIFSGRCHPSDHFCMSNRDSLSQFARQMRGQIRIAVIPDYNLDISSKLISGADVWLNNPIIPREASGTSGMKAALNGLLNLSILDGWWCEGHQMTPEAGWAFGADPTGKTDAQRDDDDAASLYEALEDVIQTYYETPDQWKERMLQAVSLVGHFNSHRCIDEYFNKMWN